EEELVTEAFRGTGAENTANPGGQLDRRNKILAAHLVVDAKDRPAHAPVGFPLKLAVPAGDRQLLPGAIDVLEHYGARLGVMLQDRNLQYLAGRRRNGQEGAVGLLPFFAKC